MPENCETLSHGFRRGPHKVDREKTDTVCVGLFFGTLFSWIITIIIVLSMGQQIPKVKTPSGISLIFTEYILRDIVGHIIWMITFVAEFFTHCPISMAIGLGGLMISARFVPRLIRMHPAFWTDLSMAFLIFHIIGLIMVDFRMLVNSRTEFPELGDDFVINNYEYVQYNGSVKKVTGYSSSEITGILVKHTINIFGCIFALICSMPNKPKIAHILKNTVRIFYFYFRLVYFGVLFFGLQLVIMYLSAKAFMNLGQFDWMAYIILFVGIYLSNFVHCYLMMIISQVTATWYWSISEAKPRREVIKRCFASVTRYHLGTVAFNATIILPMIVAVFVVFKSPIRRPEFFDILLIFYLICNISEHSPATTAITGQNFMEATKTTCQTLTKKSSLSFAFIIIYKSAIILITAFIVFSCGLPHIISQYLFGSDVGFFVLALRVISLFGIFFSPVTLILNCIGKAILFCMMDEYESQSIPALVRA